MGLPCPNIGTGGYAFHGLYEHITAEGMDAVVEMLLYLASERERQRKNTMELFDIRTPDGKVTGRVKEREQVHRDGDLHGTAHVWLVRRKADTGWEILLQKRSQDKDSFPGCYDISSAGHIPAGSGYRDSAVRELEEELGIQAAPGELKFVGMHDALVQASFHGKPWKNHELSAVYVLYCDLEPEQMRLQKSELSEVCWIGYEECKESMKNPDFRHCIFEDEILMLGAYLNGKRNKDECDAHT